MPVRTRTWVKGLGQLARLSGFVEFFKFIEFVALVEFVE